MAFDELIIIGIALACFGLGMGVVAFVWLNYEVDKLEKRVEKLEEKTHA